MYSEIAANKRKTLIIMFFFVLFMGGLSYLLGMILKNAGITIAILIGALIYAAISYWAGSKWSLALSGARPVEKKDNPRLYRIIENLAITDGLPTPKIYLIDDPAPNAFATGRDPAHASVCATTGLLEIMNDTELQGVFAHELGHVKNYDMRVSMVAFALVAVIGVLADIILNVTWFRGDDREDNQAFLIAGIIAAILAPIVATLIQLAISRRREFLADATGALTTRYPEGLASALAKIEQTGSALKRQNTATAHFFFANPLKGHSLLNLFSTHPPIEERIKRLTQMDLHQ